MKGNISIFVDNAKAGRLSVGQICRGIAQFVAAIDCQVKSSSPSTSAEDTPLHYSGEDVRSDGFQTAVSSFTHLVLRTTKKELAPTIFLTTEFDFELFAGEDPMNTELAVVNLVKGLDSLTQIHARSSTDEPLQRWANIAIAANFLLSHSSNVSVLSIATDLPNVDLEDDDNETAKKRPSGGRSTEKSLQHLDTYADIKSCPLGMLVEQDFGVRKDCHESEDKPGYRRAYKNWERFLANFVSDAENSQDFRVKLSKAQRSSGRLLIEWWNNEIGLGDRTRKAFQIIEDASHTGYLDSDALQLFGIDSIICTDRKRLHYLQRLLFDCSGPSYHTFMFRLFQMEFLSCHYFGALSRKSLKDSRQKAAKLAACQRVSVNCYDSLIGHSTRPLSTNMEGIASRHQIGESAVSSTADTREISDSMRLRDDDQEPLEALKGTALKNAASELPLGRDTQSRLEETQNPRRAVTKISHELIGASLCPCDWLEDPQDLEGLPHYLWDVRKGQTVLTSKLPQTVEYTAISHTWGRYQHRDYTSFPKVSLEGTSEWSIPQNSKFQVDRIPDILALVPFNTPFVWFDLVCIPQEPTDERLTAIAKKEIGIQAMIFRRAKYAVAWLNDITTWKGVNAAIRRLSFHFLQDGVDENVQQSNPGLTSLDNNPNLELFDDSSGTNEWPEDSMNRWFSSLWTLQEVCLRPDMRLCNKRWELLAVGEEGSLHLGIDDLVALADGGHFRADAWETVQGLKLAKPETERLPSSGRIDVRSKATEQLWELLDLSGLEHLLHASRTTILTLGNQRYCERNRAEAIMSAIGVTDWFEDYQPEAGEIEDRSVSPEYPLVFVREAAAKLGAEFYASNLAEGELLEMLVLSLQPVGMHREGVGSMLPFTSSLLSRAPSSIEDFAGPDHPTVSDWTILEDRSVMIREAAIHSYTGQSRPKDRGLNCACIAPNSNEPNPLLVKSWTTLDLDTWIDSFLPSTRNYAVCLHHGCGLVDGILLKELSSGDLIKVGTYHFTQPNAYKYFQPPTYNVTWHVL